MGRVESGDQPERGNAVRGKIGVVGIGHERQVRRERQAGARGGLLHPGIEAFKAGRERGQSRCAADGIEIDVEDHAPARGRLHAFEPEARSDETPFLGAEQAYSQAARTSARRAARARVQAPSATATPVALSIALSPCGWPSMCALTTTQSGPRPGRSAISMRVHAG